MKLRASLNDYDQEQEIIIGETDGNLCVEIDGRQYQIEVHHSEENSYLIVNETRVYDCRVQHQPRSRDRYDVGLKGQHYSVTIIDPRRLRADENSDRHHHGPTEVRAQMPGKVVRVLVEAGAHVEKGAGLIVVEAMKMQNEMKSPLAGVVVSVNVRPGDTVNAGEILAILGD